MEFRPQYIVVKKNPTTIYSGWKWKENTILTKFEKISFEQYFKDMNDTFYSENYVDLSGEEGHGIKTEYEDIKLPKRATKNSAGYDFFAPFGFELKVGQSIKIPTGIKCCMDESLFLGIVPRSSLGFKYTMRLANTFAVVDGDYYNNENNEGHIFIKIVNESRENKTLKVKKGEAFAQGIFFPYFLTDDDNVTEIRTGGIGSTNK